MPSFEMAANGGLKPAFSIEADLVLERTSLPGIELEVQSISSGHMDWIPHYIFTSNESKGERLWPSGYGVGLRSRGFDPHTGGHCSLLKLMQFHFRQFASVYSAGNEYQHCWEGTCDGLASLSGESVQLHYNCSR